METIQPDKFRKYMYEYTVFALAACVVYLFIQFNILNAYIRTDLANDKKDAVKALYQNSIILEQVQKQLK